MGDVVQIALPAEVVALFGARDQDISRWLTELAVLGAYREGRISAGRGSEILGMSYEDGEWWLPHQRAPLPNDFEDFESDRRILTLATEEDNLLLLPHFVRSERESVLEEIYSAFENTTLGEGRSWMESVGWDGHDGKLAAKLREEDECVTWQEKLDDPEWEGLDAGLGGWTFLDDEGFFYYLPAALVLCIREFEDSDFPNTLKNRQFKKSSLGKKQHQCFVRVVQLMVAECAFINASSEQWWNLLQDEGFLKGTGRWQPCDA